MQTAVTKYVHRLEALKKDVPIVARKILLENKDKVLQIHKEKQLGIGLNSKGTPLTWFKGNGFYTKGTEILAKIGKPTKPIKPKVAGKPYNFEWTGSTMKKRFLTFDDFYSYSIFSKDKKAEYLESVFDNGIFDLTEENNERVNQEILLPQLIEWLLQNLKIT